MTGYLDVKHSGETYRVLVKRAPAARRFTLRIRAATRDVTRTIPRRGALADAREFAERHAAWIGARLRRLLCPCLSRPVRSYPFEANRIGSFIGLMHAVPCGLKSRAFPCSAMQRSYCVCRWRRTCVAPYSDFLKHTAKREIETSVRKYAAAIGKSVSSRHLARHIQQMGFMHIGGPSEFLVAADLCAAFVLDYLAAHEVGHLVHLNHSPRFWKLVKSICVETDRAEAWLTRMDRACTAMARASRPKFFSRFRTLNWCG